MTIYEKYLQQKEKYCPVFTQMKISFDKTRNSILYTAGNGDRLSVIYDQDMKKIDTVFAKHKNDTKWQCLNDLLNHLDSSVFYYDFSSSYNPFSTVAPPHLSSLEEQGLFDVMMEVANEWVQQNKIPAVLGVQYTGYGYAFSPVAMAKHQSLGLSTEDLYVPGTLYTKNYFVKAEMINKNRNEDIER